MLSQDLVSSFLTLIKLLKKLRVVASLADRAIWYSMVVVLRSATFRLHDSWSKRLLLLPFILLLTAFESCKWPFL